MTDSTIITLGKLGCTGYIDYNGRLLHDGDTCPVHETETIDALDTSRGPDAAWITPDGSEVYFSTVHNSWVRRWEQGGEPYSENISETQAATLTEGAPR